jgi:hypothetical protein
MSASFAWITTPIRDSSRHDGGAAQCETDLSGTGFMIGLLCNNHDQVFLFRKNNISATRDYS